MTNAKYWITRTIAGLILVGLVVLWFRESENDPLIDGKPLSKYLEDCSIAGIHFGPGTTGGGMLSEPIEPFLANVRVPPESRDAILREGANALPMLVRMLSAGETRWDQWRRLLVVKYGLSARLMNTNWAVAWQRKTQALAAFEVLGTNAAPAAAQIIPLLNYPETAIHAIVAIKLIRPERGEQFLKLTNVARIRRPSRTGAPRDKILSEALLALGSFGSRASNAVPFLVGALASTNTGIQAAAAVALARIGAPTKQGVPLIIETLPKTDPTPPTGPIGLAGMEYVTEILMKVWALEQYGPEAQEALPMLSVISKYRTGNFETAARKAMARIEGKAVPDSND